MTSFVYRLDFTFLATYKEVLLKGLIVTIELSTAAMGISTLIAMLLGVLASREGKIIRCTSLVIIDAIRSVPLLVLMLTCYYALPLFGVYTDAFLPALIALSLDTGAFLGDVFRGSIAGIPKGSILAAKALGMRQSVIVRRVIFPEVARETLPTVVLMYIGIIRTSSLASVIALSELTHAGGWIISSTYKPLEGYLSIGFLYALVIAPLTVASRWVEKRPYFRRRAV